MRAVSAGDGDRVELIDRAKEQPVAAGRTRDINNPSSVRRQGGDGLCGQARCG